MVTKLEILEMMKHFGIRRDDKVTVHSVGFFDFFLHPYPRCHPSINHGYTFFLLLFSAHRFPQMCFPLKSLGFLHIFLHFFKNPLVIFSILCYN